MNKLNFMTLCFELKDDIHFLDSHSRTGFIIEHSNINLMIVFLEKRAFLKVQNNFSRSNIEKVMMKPVFFNAIKAILSLPLANLTPGWVKFKLL